MITKNFILILISFFILSCKTTPESASISEEEINAQAAKAYAEVKAKSKISTNKEWTAMVNRVAQRIAVAANKPYKWEVVLIDSPEVNAWCMPGGKMAVYTGIMPVLKTEAALAAVMGHEVAHATLKHGLAHYAQAQQSNMIAAGAALTAIVLGEALCKTDSCKKWAQLGGIAGGFAVAFFDMKFSREDESSADKEGQIYMADAGYEPSEAIKLWERMGAAGGGKPPELLSTHPSDVRRRGNLQAWLPAAQVRYNSASNKYGLGATIK